MHEVQVEPMSLQRLASVLSVERQAMLVESRERARHLLAQRTVWNINSTASGGGVAEMLQALLAYTRGAGVQTRWLVIDGSPDFFVLTKRIHNLLHGSAGDGGATGPAELSVYERALDGQLERLRALVKPGDRASVVVPTPLLGTRRGDHLQPARVRPRLDRPEPAMGDPSLPRSLQHQEPSGGASRRDG